MSSNLVDYSFTQDNDAIQLIERFRTNVASGSAAAMASRALATLGAAYAVGATRFGTSVKVHQRTVNHVEGVHWDVTVYSRTVQFDDLIMNSASGTTVDTGFTSNTEQILRDRHPTSGATFMLGDWVGRFQHTQPYQQIWFDRVHDVFPATQTRNLVGAINNATFLGDVAGTWLCESINTNTVRTDSGSRFLTRYTFTYKEETWTARRRAMVWNGLNLAVITAAAKATAAWVLYRDANFATYGFTLP